MFQSISLKPRLETLSQNRRVRSQAVSNIRIGESQDDAAERRARESARVEERVINIYNEDDFNAQLKAAGKRLVVLETDSDVVCETGLVEEAEIQWKRDKRVVMIPCKKLKHTFQRIARDCPDVVFLNLLGDATDDARALSAKLGVKKLPTVQFFRDGKLLYTHSGYMQQDGALTEGVMFYADQGGSSTRVEDLQTMADLRKFVAEAPAEELVVVDISLSNATPCIKIYPAVLALAKNFSGVARFARFLIDKCPEDEEATVAKELNLLEVPTFLFYKGGELQHRFVGSSRGDLLGQVLRQLGAQV